MFACTKVAKEFRDWVLDILDKEAPQQPVGNPTPEMEEEAMLKHLSSSRWLLTFGDARTSFFKRVPDDTCVMSTDKFLEAINEPQTACTSAWKNSLPSYRKRSSSLSKATISRKPGLKVNRPSYAGDKLITVAGKEIPCHRRWGEMADRGRVCHEGR